MGLSKQSAVSLFLELSISRLPSQSQRWGQDTVSCLVVQTHEFKVEVVKKKKVYIDRGLGIPPNKA